MREETPSKDKLVYEGSNKDLKDIKEIKNDPTDLSRS